MELAQFLRHTADAGDELHLLQFPTAKVPDSTILSQNNDPEAIYMELFKKYIDESAKYRISEDSISEDSFVVALDRYRRCDPEQQHRAKDHGPEPNDGCFGRCRCCPQPNSSEVFQPLLGDEEDQ